MKKFLLLLVALFATTALVKAESIAYPENPYGWQRIRRICSKHL